MTDKQPSDKPPTTTTSAVLSPCRKYRYELVRSWGDGRTVCFIGLNPSTADEMVDDATIRKCMKYARRWGYDRLLMLNVFAYRATKPADMNKAHKARVDIVGIEGNTIADIVERLRAHEVHQIICAWGANAGQRGTDVLLGLRESGFRPECFGLNADGSPVHPLYQRDDAPTKYA